ncbi:MAG: valine--tRNA ligase [Alphaproteobacteria bacterium]
MLEKKYDSAQTEKFFYDLWERSGCFKSQSKGSPYTIIMPPANVTGSLHLGHALTFTLQDILIRFHRLKGKDVLWQAGTDHAGIATQMVVERQLGEQGVTRQELGREKFLEEVWKWKEQSGGAIISQLKRLGASADWSRERFTMDDHANHCVKNAFIQLYEDGLIYRDKRLVNWDAKYQTAISDLEVVQKEQKGKMYYLRYPLETTEGHIVVATTRPETFFGDVAVAVHPQDERYSSLIGQRIGLPLTHRSIPVVGDEYCDPTKGTGAVKITPAHDFNDFEVGQRHQLKGISVLDVHNRLKGEGVPSDYEGLSVSEARTKVVAFFEEQGLLEKIDEVVHVVPHGDRSDMVIEPRLTDQWYVDAATLSKKAIAAVEMGEMVFFPEQWTKVYFEWLNNIQPWCISRQIWWGHSIPAWYGPDGQVFVASTLDEAQVQAQKIYGHPVDLVPDPDVLDTWFSSGLWPVITLEGFENHADFQKYYPTNVLVTGFDILFFWVARMMMLGLYFTHQVPFRHVYMHALVRDAKGQKMSKSKGNVIDPLYLIDNYGADALRFTLASLAAPGRDIKLGEPQVEASRNFITKFWNAARYAFMNGAQWNAQFKPQECASSLNQWVVAETALCIKNVETSLDNYRFHEASQSIYQFLWGTLCDWYLELTKPVLLGTDEEAKTEIQHTLGWVIGQLCHVMHPIMPFVTEEIWKAVGGDGLLIGAAWPKIDSFSFEPAQKETNWIIDVISAFRSLRNELGIEPGFSLKVSTDSLSAEAVQSLQSYKPILERMGRLEIATDRLSGKTIDVVVGLESFQVEVLGAFDPQQEMARLQKECEKIESELSKVEKKLSDSMILAKAPQEIIDELNDRKESFRSKQEKYQQSLGKIKRLLE